MLLPAFQSISFGQGPRVSPSVPSASMSVQINLSKLCHFRLDFQIPILCQYSSSCHVLLCCCRFVVLCSLGFLLFPCMKSFRVKKKKKRLGNRINTQIFYNCSSPATQGNPIQHTKIDFFFKRKYEAKFLITMKLHWNIATQRKNQ